MAQKVCVPTHGGWKGFIHRGRFSISKTYELIKPSLEWRKLMMDDNGASSRNKFVVWLLARQRLTIFDRLHKWE